MSIQALSGFPDVLTVHGGCAVCGANYVRDPAIGVPQCVDTGVRMEFDGALLFCGTCAVQIGAAAGLVSPNTAEALSVSAHDELLIAGESLARAEELAAAAKADREAIERLLGDFYGAAEAPDTGKPARKAAAK